ncbi:hypothetical protein C8R44DRAFT_754762 [Mycena epipterygia]|nr:hypothetical protein C8R44DRAFT_754762 [Mycena epipterygia]
MHRWAGRQLVCVLLIIDMGSARGNLRQLHAARSASHAPRSSSAPCSSAFDIDIHHKRVHSVRHASAILAHPRQRIAIFDTHSRPVDRRIVRPRRVTVRGQGIVTPWAERMTREDKKMRRKRRGTSNTPTLSTYVDTGRGLPACGGEDGDGATKEAGEREGALVKDDAKSDRRCIGGGVNARMGRDSRGRGRDGAGGSRLGGTAESRCRGESYARDAGGGRDRRVGSHCARRSDAQIGRMGGCTVVHPRWGGIAHNARGESIGVACMALWCCVRSALAGRRRAGVICVDGRGERKRAEVQYRSVAVRIRRPMIGRLIRHVIPSWFLDSPRCNP